MIFINFFCRSSRATAPKMRVPRGLLSASSTTIAFRSNRTGEPSSRRIAFFVRSQVFDAVDRRDVDVFNRYAGDDYLASGWAHGADDRLAGAVAGVRIALGDGQVILHAFEPAFRAQPHGTFKLFFNPLFASTVEAPIWVPTTSGSQD